MGWPSVRPGDLRPVAPSAACSSAWSTCSEGRRPRRARRARRGRRAATCSTSTPTRTTTAPCSPSSARRRPAGSPPRRSPRIDLRDPRRASTPASAWSTWCRSCRSRRRRWPTPWRPGTAFADWAGAELGLPVLPLRARAHAARGPPAAPSPTWRPTPGPPQPHPTAGAVRGGRPAGAGGLQPLARRPGPRRGPRRWPPRCAGPACAPSACAVGDQVQVSMNLVDAADGSGPPTACDRVARARPPVAGAELVGLVPARGARRRSTAGPLGRRSTSAPDRTIEARLGRCGRWLEPVRRGRRRRGGRGPAGGGCGDAHARSSRPRCRTSRRWPGRTRGSPRARRSPGTPPWPPGWTRPARGRRGRDRRRGSWRSPATRRRSLGLRSSVISADHGDAHVRCLPCRTSPRVGVRIAAPGRLPIAHV